MLEIKDLVFNPTGERNILNGVNLQIPDGKLIAITGPNGGGKTTLAKTIVGINKPNSGEIIFEGKDITNLDPTQHAKLGISFAFQQPVRFKGILVRDLLNLAAGRTLTEDELKAVLEKVGMEYKAYVDRAVDNYLSGGEIKRIEIATVILRDSKLAVFDEPEAGIDLWSFNNLIRVFENLRDERKCTIIVISHQERILSIADEIVMIQDGKVGLTGASNKLFKGLICKNDCNDCCTVKEEK
ncbi:MAG: ATP-binding cassette domain-containing protein [Bacillota bacterium]|nr:ATP-binding cassette domain-containing protein [Bacillota bacterium]